MSGRLTDADRPPVFRLGARVILPDGDTGTVVGMESLPIEGDWLTVKVHKDGSSAAFKKYRPREVKLTAESRLTLAAETMLQALYSAEQYMREDEPDDHSAMPDHDGENCVLCEVREAITEATGS